MSLLHHEDSLDYQQQLYSYILHLYLEEVSPVDQETAKVLTLMLKKEYIKTSTNSSSTN